MHTTATPPSDPEITFWAERNLQRCQQAHRRQHAANRQRTVQAFIEKAAAQLKNAQQVAA